MKNRNIVDSGWIYKFSQRINFFPVTKVGSFVSRDGSWMGLSKG